MHCCIVVLLGKMTVHRKCKGRKHLAQLAKDPSHSLSHIHTTQGCPPTQYFVYLLMGTLK